MKGLTKNERSNVCIPPAVVCKQNVPADGEKALIAINATYTY